MAKKVTYFRKPQQSPAFTLMELLVVIAIIALLMSILTPSLQKAKSLARRVVCGAQMRQITFGALMYAEANKDRFWKASPYLNHVTANAYASILDYTGLMQNAPEPDINENYSDELKSIMHDAGQKLFLCPNHHKSKSYLPAFAFKSVTGWQESCWQIGYSTLVGFEGKSWDWTSAVKTTDKPLGHTGDDPAGRLPLFTDINNEGPPYVNVAHPQKGSAVFANIAGTLEKKTPLDYDLAGTNISFIDGAVEWRKAGEVRSHRPGVWW